MPERRRINTTNWTYDDVPAEVWADADDRLGVPLTNEVRDAILAAYVYGKVTAGQRDRSFDQGGTGEDEPGQGVG